MKIIADCLNELETFIESVKQKTILQENDFSNDSDLLEQEKWISDLLPV